MIGGLITQTKSHRYIIFGLGCAAGLYDTVAYWFQCVTDEETLCWS